MFLLLPCGEIMTRSESSFTFTFIYIDYQVHEMQWPNDYRMPRDLGLNITSRDMCIVTCCKTPGHLMMQNMPTVTIKYLFPGLECT